MAVETPAREQEKFVLRLPDGMRDRLKAEAEANKRSMNAEIVARLEASLAQVERVRQTIFHGGRPLEIDDEAVEGMMLLLERARERHEAKYGVVPPEERKPVRFPVRVADPVVDRVEIDDLSDDELRQGVDYLQAETARLQTALKQRSKKND